MGIEMGFLFIAIWSALVTHNVEAVTRYKGCYDKNGKFYQSEQLRCDKIKEHVYEQED